MSKFASRQMDKLARVWPYWTPPPKSHTVLDNFGLTVSIGMLEHTPAYREAHRRLFGRGRLGRWWMGVVFPRIRPKEHARRLVEFEKRRAKMRQEFMAAVLAKVQE